MKKLLLGILGIIATVSLVACGEKEEVKPAPTNTPDNTQVVDNTETTNPVVEEPVVAPKSGDEQIGVGNTDESMVVLALEQHYKKAFGDIVEEVNPTHIKIYTDAEISGDEAIKSHDIKEGDIVFSAEYELKIKDTVSGDDLMQFTAGTGEIDGQWIRNKSNVGIARNNGEAGYTIDAFGTGF